MSYYQVLISAEERVQGMAVLSALIARRLAYGSPVFSGGALFLEENEVAENDHRYAVTDTRADLNKYLPMSAVATHTRSLFA